MAGVGIGGVGSSIVGSLISKGIDIAGNAVNGLIQEKFNNNFMERYGSAGAQWDQLIRRGVNPYALAGQSLSNSGSSGISTSFGSGDFASSLTGMANSTLNPLVSQNVQSQTNANNATARNTNSVTQYNEATLQTRVDMLTNQKQLSDLELGIKSEYAGRYSEVLSLNMEQVRKAIDKTKSEISKLDEEKKKIERETEEINQKIDNMKSEKELTEARTRLTNLQSTAQSIDNRIQSVKANNMEQFGIEGGTASEAAFIAGLNGDDATVEAYDTFQKKLREAEAEGSTSGTQKSLNENDPVRKQQQEVIDRRDKELAKIDEEIAYWEGEERKAGEQHKWRGFKASTAHAMIQRLQDRRKRVVEDAQKEINRISKGTSQSVSVGPVSASGTNQ